MNTPKLKKMYVLVRKDLDVVYRLVQGSHAIAEYSLRGDAELYREWNNSTLVYLGVRNEQTLMLWVEKIKARGKNFATFNEPDLRGQLTAIACIDTGEIFKDLNIV